MTISLRRCSVKYKGKAGQTCAFEGNPKTVRIRGKHSRYKRFGAPAIDLQENVWEKSFYL